jgi:hypothetical protein
MRIIRHSRDAMSGRLLIAVVISALVVLIVTPAAAAVGNATTTRTISGTVTVDGVPAAADTLITAEAVTDTGTIACGSATVSDGGAFTLELAEACKSGLAMRLLLADVGTEAKDQVTVPSSDVEGELVRFETAPPPQGDAGVGQTLADAEAERSRPVISDGGLILLLGVIAVGTIVFLGFIAYQWAAAAHGERTGTNPVANLAQLVLVIPQVLVEGMVLSLAIVAIVILGASAKLTSEGLVSVLAAIVGYAAGRSAGAAERRA